MIPVAADTGVVINNINANNEEYFFNCKTYKEKWKSLAIWVSTLNTRFAGSDYYYGALDFYRYIINDPDQYINIYGERFYEYPEIVDPFDTYKYSEEDIVLPVPLSETFKGWYLNSDFSGSPVTVIEAGTIGNIELFACWDTTITYEIYFNTDETLTRSVNDIRTLRQSLHDALNAGSEPRPDFD